MIAEYLRNFHHSFARNLYFFLANMISDPDERELFTNQVSFYLILLPQDSNQPNTHQHILVNDKGVALEYLSFISNLLSSQNDRFLDRRTYKSEEIFRDACFVFNHYQTDLEMQYQII